MDAYEYVQVPVPKALVPMVIQLVADHLAEAGEGPTMRIDETTWSDIAASGDEDGVGYYWWRWLRPVERDVMRALASAPGGTLEVSAASQQLGMTPGELAGVLGPLTRRSRRDGYPAAVLSRQQVAVDGRRVKILSLADGLAGLVLGYDTGEPPEDPPKPKPVRRRQRSAAAETLRARPAPRR